MNELDINFIEAGVEIYAIHFNDGTIDVNTEDVKEVKSLLRKNGYTIEAEDRKKGEERAMVDATEEPEPFIRISFEE